MLVYLHAGGWIAGDRTGVPDVVTAQVARGYALASVDYQLATVDASGRPIPSFPGAVWDVKRAIRFLKANAEAWSLDPLRVVVVGTSAGGHLAALVAATRGALEAPELPPTRAPRRDSSVRGVVDIVGPTDLATFQPTDHPWAAPLTASFLGCPAPTDGQSGTCASDQLRRASVATYVDRSDPPILLVYGALDTLVVPATQGEPLARIWRDAHGGDPDSASYLVIETAGHTLPSEDTLGPLTTFLDRVNGLAATGRADAAARPVVLYGDSSHRSRSVCRRRRRGSRPRSLDRDPRMSPGRALHRRNRRLRYTDQRRARARRRALLSRGAGADRRSDRRLPGLVEWSLPVRYGHGQLRHRRPAPVGSPTPSLRRSGPMAPEKPCAPGASDAARAARTSRERAANEPLHGSPAMDPESTASAEGTDRPVSDVEWVGQSRRMKGLAPRVEFCALGPVGVIVDGQPVTLGSPKLRTVLAALLVDANSVVSSDRLIDILWGDDQPVSAEPRCRNSSTGSACWWSPTAARTI